MVHARINHLYYAWMGLLRNNFSYDSADMGSPNTDVLDHYDVRRAPSVGMCALAWSSSSSSPVPAGSARSRRWRGLRGDAALPPPPPCWSHHLSFIRKEGRKDGRGGAPGQTGIDYAIQLPQAQHLSMIVHAAPHLAPYGCYKKFRNSRRMP